MLQEKRFGSNKEVTAEVEVYFENKDKSFYEKERNRAKSRSPSHGYLILSPYHITPSPISTFFLFLLFISPALVWFLSNGHGLIPIFRIVSRPFPILSLDGIGYPVLENWSRDL
ncbi:hypothetical protein TNCV_3434101 [Trichonephila clavipes]|nr:hypothetical protein TNCV_3434101 [Trichonephila clavipes]